MAQLCGRKFTIFLSSLPGLAAINPLLRGVFYPGEARFFFSKEFLLSFGISVLFSIGCVFFYINDTAAQVEKPYLTDAGQLNYAKFLFQEKEYKAAAREYARLIENFPASPLVPEAQFRMSEAFYNAGLYRDAEAELKLFLKNFGDTAFAPAAKARLKDLETRKETKGKETKRENLPVAALPEKSGAPSVSAHHALAKSPLSGFNPADLADNKAPAIFFDARGFAADNAGIPVIGLLWNDWDPSVSPQAGLNRAIVYWNTDTGAAYGGFRVAGFYRGEFYIDANKDTVDFLGMINRKEALPAGRVFDIKLSSIGYSAKGIEVSKGIALFKGLSAGVTARYISGGMLQDATITGSVKATSRTTYDFNFLLDYNYDKNLVYPRVAVPGTGNGYSFDFGLRYSAGEVLSAGVLLRDIGGRLYWRNVPFSTAAAVSNIKSFDSFGYQQYRPSIQGFEGYRDFTQMLPLKVDADITAVLGRVTLSPEVNIIKGRPLYWVFLGYKATENASFSAGYNTNYKAWSAGLAYKKSLLSVYSSGIDPVRAPALGAALTILWDW